MNLTTLISWASQQGASDLHLEPGLPPAIRVRGSLRAEGEPIPPRELADAVSELLGPDGMTDFEQRGSADLAATLGDCRCRINALRTARGPGLAIRLLSSRPVSIDSLNLHPQLTRLIDQPHGLIIVSGPTGCGKSSTLAALVQEINMTRASHIVTIEQPIEFDLRPVRSFVRQREVGRDTPSFGQALLDSMREDPDVLMVGEMRDRETMRLTLDACETGHLVLTTLHSATVVEALQRIVSAFPAEEQTSVCAQLADVLVAVVSQRLVYRSDLGIRVPECEILLGTAPVKSTIRQGQLFRLITAMETGGQAGQWTLDRYRRWLNERTEWHVPDSPASPAPPPGQSRPAATAPLAPSAAPPTAAPPAAASQPAATPAQAEQSAEATAAGPTNQPPSAPTAVRPLTSPTRRPVSGNTSSPVAPPRPAAGPPASITPIGSITPITPITPIAPIAPTPSTAPISLTPPPVDETDDDEDIFVIDETGDMSDLLNELEDEQGT